MLIMHPPTLAKFSFLNTDQSTQHLYLKKNNEMAYATTLAKFRPKARKCLSYNTPIKISVHDYCTNPATKSRTKLLFSICQNRIPEYKKHLILKR